MSGGTLATNTYYYVITAVNAVGETVGSIERSVSVTGPTGSVGITWGTVSTATGYRVYRSSGIDQSHRQAVYFPASGTSFTDTGGAGTAGTPPAIGTEYLNKLSGGNLTVVDEAYGSG